MTRLRTPVDLRSWLLLGLAFIATLFVYHGGLSGGFVLDDEVSLQQNANIRLTALDPDSLLRAASSSDTGPLRRPLSMLSFAMQWYADGALVARHVKIANLAIHLFNGLLVYLLGCRLLAAWARSRGVAPEHSRAQLAAAIAAAAWLLHPLALTCVLYSVQRMTSLSTAIVLLGLVAYLSARDRVDGRRTSLLWPAATLAIATTLAMTAKESGVLLPLYAFAIELTLLDFSVVRREGRATLKTFFNVLVGVPAIALAVWFLLDPHMIVGGYAVHDFDLGERLMTEARVLWFYLRLVFAPDLGALGLYHDDFEVSRGLLQPVSTAIAIVGLVALVASAWLLRRRAPWLAFAVFFFLAGHLLESGPLALELVFEHRNYLPMFGLLLAASQAMVRTEWSWDTRYACIAVTAGFLLLCAATTALRAGDWASPLRFATVEVEHHPKSTRANYDIAFRYAEMMRTDPNPIVAEIDYRHALYYLERAHDADPHSVAALVGRVILDYEHGRTPPVAVMAALRSALARPPFLRGSVAFVKALADCTLHDKCHIDDRTMVGLFDAVLTNPSLAGQRLAVVMTSAADYIGLRGHNLPQALELTRAAARAAPADARMRLNLAELLIASARQDEARGELVQARRLDRFRALAGEIDAQERRLAQNGGGNR